VCSDRRTLLSGFVGNRTVGHSAAARARAAIAGAPNAGTAVAGAAESCAARDGAAETIAAHSARHLTGVASDSRCDRTRRGLARGKRLSLAGADHRRDDARCCEKWAACPLQK
jgi:hypothetical protein